MLEPEPEGLAMERPVTSSRSTWPVGQRVSRKTTHELGTVIEHDGEIKVKWDGGKTSYYRHGQDADVELAEAEQ